MNILFRTLVLFTPGLVMPGADAIVILRTSLESRIKGLYLTIGVLIGDLFFKFISVFGLSEIFLQHEGILKTVRIFGVIFLLYLGISSIISRSENQKLEEINETKKLNLLVRGFLTNISNPMAIVFITTITITVLDVDSSLTDKVIVFLVMFFEAVIWFGLLFYFSSRDFIRNLYEKYSRILNIALGSLLIFFALIILKELIFT